MQELSISIKQRINKTKEVVEQQLGSDSIRFLREEQKIRCEKQNFILAMMRANKIMSVNLKKSYFRVSSELMTLLEPSFEYKQRCSIEQDFLNEFVHLYTSFFAFFESRFTFKTKIKNFLRPTNHNLIVDLVKYFVDFTRDYYVQTLFWKMKNSSKKQINLSDQTSPLQENIDEINLAKIKPIGSICRSYSIVTDPGEPFSISPRKKTDENEEKRNNQKNYQILDVSIPFITVSNLKENFATMNIQSLKIKINELFREQKSRNGPNKRICEDFYTSYKEKFNKSESPELPSPYTQILKRSDRVNVKCQPLRMFLNIQKSGFSIIQLEIDPRKTRPNFLPPKLYTSSNLTSLSTSPTKQSPENSLSPLKITQRVSQAEEPSKGDYFLTSMKVLRVSENFLPPLVNSSVGLISNESLSRNQAKEGLSRGNQKNENSMVPFSLKLKKMTDQIEDQVPFINQISNSHNVLVRSTSFKKSTAEQERKKLESYNNELYAGEFVWKRESSQSKARRKDSYDESYRLSNKKLHIKKKLLDNRRGSQNGSYFPIKSHHSKAGNSGHNHQSEEKILQWLEKIKNLKQIQRKKILGMNF